jgi:para-aminobenzoate synthetase component I
MPRTFGLICESIELELPLWRYVGALEHLPYTTLLDSQRPSDAAGKSNGRYSYLAWAPFLLIEGRRSESNTESAAEARAHHYALAGAAARVRVLDRRVFDSTGGHDFSHSTEYSADYLAELTRLTKQYQISSAERALCPLPFACGMVGYLSYEFGELLERLPHAARHSLGLPLASFGFYDAVVGVDHELKRSYLTLLLRGRSEAEARVIANARREVILQQLATASSALNKSAARQSAKNPAPDALGTTAAHRAQATNGVLDVAACTSAEYIERIETVREAIAAGRVFEANLTQQFTTSFTGSAFELFSALRESTPNPFAALLTLRTASVVCASPERFLSVSATGAAESRPIKGTRARGVGTEDTRLRQELTDSAKDRAENLMIVDLIRSDFGRCCALGSVQAVEVCVVETHPQVHHLVSTVRGQLAPGKTALDLVRACFPGGSMTGAPKIEAMTLLRELEPDERGIYAGSIGYLDINGALDWNIVIRTAVLCRQRAHVGAGGAIVTDSVAADEYAECLIKIAPLVSALEAIEHARARTP